MRAALHAEWTKMRTVRGPRWLLLGLIAATVALSAAVTSVVTCRTTGCDPARLSLTGVQLGQALAAVLAVSVVAGEYRDGMIRTTLTAMPRRATVLAAKAVALAGAVGVAGTAAVLGSLLAARIIAPRPGLVAADGPTLRAAAGSILYLVLIALLSLGVAAAVRDAATSIGIVLGLLYLLPILSAVIGDPHWQRLLRQIAPMTAALPVNVGWAAAALVTGGLLVHRRDA